MIVQWLQGLTGMSAEEMRYLAAVSAVCTGVSAFVTFLYVKSKVKLDHLRKLDRNNLVVVTLVFTFMKDDKIRLEALSDSEIYELHKFIGDPAVEKRMEKAVSKCPTGEPLLKTGAGHYLAMHRIRINVTGSDKNATIAAANNRFEDFHRDQMCFYLTSSNGDGGTRMPYVIMVSERFMKVFSDPEGRKYIDKIVPDYIHNQVYVTILRHMVSHYLESKRLFNEHPSEREAGQLARVWTTDILSMKVSK